MTWPQAGVNELRQRKVLRGHKDWPPPTWLLPAPPSSEEETWGHLFPRCALDSRGTLVLVSLNRDRWAQGRWREGRGLGLPNSQLPISYRCSEYRGEELWENTCLQGVKG